MLKTAVIGVGYLGRFHAQKHQALSRELGFEFAGVYDASPERSQFIAQELGVRCFQSLEEVAQNAEAVTVASATKTHYELSKYFLSRGIHVNVEKPITNDLAQAEELMQIAQSKDLILSVGHSERFSPVYGELKAKFPNPQMLEFRRHAPYKTRGADVSVILDLMIHDLDLALRWNDSFKEVIFCRAGKVVSETFDWAETALEFKSGRNVVVSASRIGGKMMRTVRGIQGSSAFRGDFQDSILEFQTWKPMQEEPVEVEEKSIPKRDHLLIETQQFIKAVQAKGALEIPAGHGVQALELALEIEKRAFRS